MLSNPVMQAFIACTFTYLITAMGSAVVFFVKKQNKNESMAIGISAGIMLAASFFSLLLPAIESLQSVNKDKLTLCLTVVSGFLCGILFIFSGEKLFTKLYERNADSNVKTSLPVLIGSITLHNIPEGMAIGVAFGECAIEGTAINTAILLAIGIGIQNFPEGSAVSLPLLNKGYSKGKAFFIGQLTALVEPIAGVFGALLVYTVKSILPFCLCFAAASMIYAIVFELLPECVDKKSKFAVIAGFLIMMFLDTALG